jgi:hypothetical protein
MKTAGAWIVAFALCTVCTFIWYIWLVGIIASMIYLMVNCNKRQIIDNLAMNAVYVLLWPFCLPFLALGRMKERRIKPVRPMESKPFKLEL